MAKEFLNLPEYVDEANALLSQLNPGLCQITVAGPTLKTIIDEAEAQNGVSETKLAILAAGDPADLVYLWETLGIKLGETYPNGLKGLIKELKLTAASRNYSLRELARKVTPRE